MCIRDRGMPMDELLGDGVTEKDLSLTLAPSAEERAKLDPFYMSYFVPVSYTHLDVYKRQLPSRPPLFRSAPSLLTRKAATSAPRP